MIFLLHMWIELSHSTIVLDCCCHHHLWLYWNFKHVSKGQRLTREKQFHLVFGVSAKKFRLEMWRFVIMTGQDKYLSPWSNDVALQDVEIDVGNVWIQFIWLKHVSQSLRTDFIWTHFELHSLNAFFPLPLKNFLTLSYSSHRCFSTSLARLQLQ